MIGARRADPNDVFFGKRGVVEQNPDDVWVGISHDALNQSAVVGASERLALAERERPSASEVGNAAFVVDVCFAFWAWRNKVPDLVKRRSSRGQAKLRSPRFNTWIEEGPADREKHRLRVAPTEGSAAMRFVEQSDRVLV